MSAAEIILELSKLTADERTAVRQRLRELEQQDEVQILNDSALATFQDSDKREAKAAGLTHHSGLKKFFSAWDASHSVTVGEKPSRRRTYADTSRLR
ncbi:MAG TPA: hypothetical protein VJT54_00380 [Verrucomicrobiae bacterium]|nr:hypothetical protein [Verrucomicrobiae bacterium]